MIIIIVIRIVIVNMMSSYFLHYFIPTNSGKPSNTNRHDFIQRPKKCELSGWQTSMCKNFLDEVHIVFATKKNCITFSQKKSVRKFIRDKKVSVNHYCDKKKCAYIVSATEKCAYKILMTKKVCINSFCSI